MALRFFEKQMTTAEIEAKLKEFAEKIPPLTAAIGSGQRRLAKLEELLKDVQFEVILGDAPEANKRKNALKNGITDQKRANENAVEDLEVVEALIEKLKASKSDAANREKIQAFNSAGKEFLDLCPGIVRLFTQLGPQLTGADAAVRKMVLLSWNGGSQPLSNIWQNALGALIALHFDGVIQGLPGKASYRSDTLAGAASLPDYMKKNLERASETLAASFKAGTVDDPGTLETDDAD